MSDKFDGYTVEIFLDEDGDWQYFFHTGTCPLPQDD